MDVLRHAAEGQLAEFAGGSQSNRQMDETQWGIAPYTQADLQNRPTFQQVVTLTRTLPR